MQSSQTNIIHICENNISVEFLLQVMEEIDNLVDAGNRHIYLYFDTDGGMLTPTLELIDYINELKSTKGLKFTALIHRAHSAGFFLAAACDEKYVCQTSSCAIHLGMTEVSAREWAAYTNILFHEGAAKEALKVMDRIQSSMHLAEQSIRLNEDELSELRTTGILDVTSSRLVEKGFAQWAEIPGIEKKPSEAPKLQQTTPNGSRVKTSFRKLPDLPNLIRIGISHYDKELTDQDLQKILKATKSLANKGCREVIFEINIESGLFDKMLRLVEDLEALKLETGVVFTCVIRWIENDSVLLATICDRRFIADNSKCVIRETRRMMEYTEQFRILNLGEAELKKNGAFMQEIALGFDRRIYKAFTMNIKQRSRFYAGCRVEFTPDELIDSGFAQSIAHPDFAAMVGLTSQ